MSLGGETCEEDKQAGVRTYGEGGNIRTPCRPSKVHFDYKIRKSMMTKVFIWLT